MSTASSHPQTQKFGAHVNPSLVKLLNAFGYARIYTRAQGTKLWDSDGNEYLDGLAAFGAASLGHNHPKLLERVRQMLADEAPNLVPNAIDTHAADLGEALARHASPHSASGLTRSMFSTTQAEAVDSAIKLARAATRKKGIVYCKGAYHGTSIGPLSVMGHGRLRDPFEPLLPQCFETVYDDLPALDRAFVEHKPAAFIVEPVQAEAGVIVPRRGYLSEAHALCKKHHVLMILDETQTGLGRSGGTMFAFQAAASQGDGPSFAPDVLVLGESLGGGLIPISATMTTPAIHDQAYGRIDRFDLHGSTFSGWALGCRVALATLSIIEEEKLAEAAASRGEQLLERLRDEIADHPFVRAVRGRGLLVGLELGPTAPKSSGGGVSGLLGRLIPGLVDLVSKRVFGQWLAIRLLEHGILCQPASMQWNVLKIEPPLTITEPEIDQIVDSIVAVLKEYNELRPLLTDVGQRIGSQLLTGWSF